MLKNSVDLCLKKTLFHFHKHYIYDGYTEVTPRYGITS
jgi:hypothetical protein